MRHNHGIEATSAGKESTSERQRESSSSSMAFNNSISNRLKHSFGCEALQIRFSLSLTLSMGVFRLFIIKFVYDLARKRLSDKQHEKHCCAWQA